MTKQEIFNKIATHLMTQGKAAIGPTGSCVYLNDQGLKCAVGCLIPDGHPGQRFTGGVWSLFQQYDDLRELFGVMPDFLGEFQNIHDELRPFGRCATSIAPVDPRKVWLVELIGIAQAYDLDASVLESFK